MQAPRSVFVALAALTLLDFSTPARAFFQLSSPSRYTFDGKALRFDQVSIAETVMPCTRSGARLKLQVRATPKSFDPSGPRGYLLAERVVDEVGPARLGCPYDAFDVSMPVSPPPPGTYYLSILVFAHPSPSDTWCIDFKYCLEDWRSLSQPITFGDTSTTGAPR